MKRENKETVLYVIVICVLYTVVGLCVGFVLWGCSSSRQIAKEVTQVVDTSKVDSKKFETFKVKDTVVVKDTVKVIINGDTVKEYRIKDRYVVKWRERVIKDTIKTQKIDIELEEKEVRKEKPPEKKNLYLWFFMILFAALLLIYWKLECIRRG